MKKSLKEYYMNINKKRIFNPRRYLFALQPGDEFYIAASLTEDDIQRLQEDITLVMDKSASLMVMESKNKELIKSRFSSLKKEARQMKKSRELAASYYKTMNNISSEPYFLDRKK